MSRVGQPARHAESGVQSRARLLPAQRLERDDGSRQHDGHDDSPAQEGRCTVPLGVTFNPLRAGRPARILAACVLWARRRALVAGSPDLGPVIHAEAESGPPPGRPVQPPGCAPVPDQHLDPVRRAAADPVDPGQRRLRRLLHQLPADGQLPGDRRGDPARPRWLEPAGPGVRAAAVRGRDRRRQGEPDPDARHRNRRLLRAPRAVAGSRSELRDPPARRRSCGRGDGGRVAPAGAAAAVDATAARLRHRHHGLHGRDRAVRRAVRAGHDAGGLVRAAGRAPRRCSGSRVA